MSDGLTALGHASSWIINLERALSQAEKELSVERAAREAAEVALTAIAAILGVSPGEDIVKVVRTTDHELTHWEKTGQDALTQLAAERAARQEAEDNLEHALAAVGAFRKAIEDIFTKAEGSATEDGTIRFYTLPTGPLHKAIGMARGTDAGGKFLAQLAAERSARQAAEQERDRMQAIAGKALEAVRSTQRADRERDAALSQLAAERAARQAADHVARTRIVELEQQIAALREGLYVSLTPRSGMTNPPRQMCRGCSRPRENGHESWCWVVALLVPPAAEGGAGEAPKRDSCWVSDGGNPYRTRACRSCRFPYPGHRRWCHEPKATDQPQSAADWSDTLPDSARRESRRTDQQQPEETRS